MGTDCSLGFKKTRQKQSMLQLRRFLWAWEVSRVTEEGSTEQFLFLGYPSVTSNSKQVDGCHHSVRELVVNENTTITHTPREFQRAEILTKSLALNMDSFCVSRKFLDEFE